MQDFETIKLGEKIKFFRKKVGLTQAQFAEKIGISEKHVSKIELGTYIPTLPNFIKMLELLNIGLDDFGIYTKNSDDNKYKKLFTLIIQSSDKEVEYYQKMIETTKEVLL